jgi:hypothetical protein
MGALALSPDAADGGAPVTPNRDALIEEIHATESVEDAVLVFVDDTSKKVQALIANYDPTGLKDLALGLTQKREAIAAAIAAGTAAAGDGTNGTHPDGTGSADPTAGGTVVDPATVSGS